MTTLSPDTHKIASGMDNFSGWLRARLRQFHEGVDLVELETRLDASFMRLKTLRAAVSEENEEIADRIFAKYIDLMEQRRLGDFE